MEIATQQKVDLYLIFKYYQSFLGKNCRSCRFDACVLAQLDISLIQFPPDFNVPELKRRLEEKRMELRQKGEREQNQSTQSQQNSQQKPSMPKSAFNTNNLASQMEKVGICK